MQELPFVFTILFMLLGPIKLIPSFGGLMQGAEPRFKRAVAIRGVVIAAAICAFVVLAGGPLLGKYRITIDAVRIAGGLVLLISALQIIFQKAHASGPGSGTPTAIELAASPVAAPMIVPPAGVAAIMLVLMFSPEYPGMPQAVAISLATIMVLDFLVMHFIDQVMRMPGLKIVLSVLGSVLIFVQAALAAQMFVTALKHLGVFGV